MFRKWLDKAKAIAMQGSDPGALAWSVTLGAVAGLFPVLGAATLLCAALGVIFRLNHAALQGANYLVYPLQIPAVLLFVRLGDGIYGVPTLALSASELSAAVASDPWGFAVTFARAGLHAVTAWALFAPAAGLILFFPLRWAFRRIRIQGVSNGTAVVG